MVKVNVAFNDWTRNDRWLFHSEAMEDGFIVFGTEYKIIDEVNALRDNSLDYYAAVRSSYYQNRKAAILNIDDKSQTPLPLISIEFE